VYDAKVALRELGGTNLWPSTVANKTGLCIDTKLATPNISLLQRVCFCILYASWQEEHDSPCTIQRPTELYQTASNKLAFFLAFTSSALCLRLLTASLLLTYLFSLGTFECDIYGKLRVRYRVLQSLRSNSSVTMMQYLTTGGLMVWPRYEVH
jgi:hypothetical protein